MAITIVPRGTIVIASTLGACDLRRIQNVWDKLVSRCAEFFDRSRAQCRVILCKNAVENRKF
jgi:hypothetical protein